MVAVIFDYEVSTSIPPTIMFKAFTIDGNVIPSVFPKGVKNIEILQGDGGPRTVVKVSLGSALKSSTDRYDVVDKDNLTYTFTTIDVEGGIDELKNVIESVSNVVKVVQSADGGSLCKITSIYNTKGDAQVTEEQVRGKHRVTFMCKNIEEYLIIEEFMFIIYDRDRI